MTSPIVSGAESLEHKESVAREALKTPKPVRTRQHEETGAKSISAECRIARPKDASLDRYAAPPTPEADDQTSWEDHNSVESSTRPQRQATHRQHRITVEQWEKCRTTTLGEIRTKIPPNLKEKEKKLKEWVKESRKSVLRPPQSLYDRQAVGHHEIHGVSELGTYLASADYIMSICGAPSPDMRYGIVIVPGYDEKLLGRGCGGAVAELERQASLAQEKESRREKVDEQQDSGNPSDKLNQQGRATNNYSCYESGRPSAPMDCRSPAGQLSHSQAVSDGDIVALVKGELTPTTIATGMQWLISQEACKVIEAALDYDERRQREGHSVLGGWQMLRERRRRHSDTYGSAADHEMSIITSRLQRDVFFHVAEVMHRLGEGVQCRNPGINASTWEAALERIALESPDNVQHT